MTILHGLNVTRLQRALVKADVHSKWQLLGLIGEVCEAAGFSADADGVEATLALSDAEIEAAARRVAAGQQP